MSKIDSEHQEQPEPAAKIPTQGTFLRQSVDGCLSDDLLFPREFLYLLLAIPLCFYLFKGPILERFQDAAITDLEIEYLGKGALIDPQSPVSFAGDWNIEGEFAVLEEGGIPADSDLTINLDDHPINFLTVRIDSAIDSRWALSVNHTDTSGNISRNFFGGSNALHNEEIRTVEIDVQSIDELNSSTLALELECIETGEAAQPLVRYISVTAGYRSGERAVSLADFAGVSLFPFVTTLFLFYGLGRNRNRAMSSGAAIILLFMIARFALQIDIGGFWFMPVLFLFVIFVIHSLALMIGQQISKKQRVGSEISESKLSPGNRKIVCGIAGAFLILMFAILMRDFSFAEAWYRQLGNDASGYVEIAAKGGYLYATDQSTAPWVREPLFPWVLRFWFDIFQMPETANSARVVSALVSLFVCILAFVAGWRLFSLPVGLMGMLMLAITPEWNEMSVRVLRHDLVLGLILAGLLIRNELQDRIHLRGFAFGIWSASMFLLQFSLGLITGPLMLWEALRKKWKPVEYVWAALMLIMLVMPHLVFNYRYKESGDFFYSSSIHTLFYLNYVNRDQPGFPTSLEFKENPYVGEPVSAGEFFFKHHTPVEVMSGFTRGYFNIFVWYQPRIFVFYGIEILMLPGLLGAFALIRSRKWWIIVYFVMAMLPFAFLSSIGADLRLGMETTLFATWVWMLGICEVHRLIQFRLKSHRAENAEGTS